jgi:far upstream element-binding protein
VHAQIAKENEMQPGETLRSIVLKGSPSGVAEAKTRIDDIITAQLMKINGGGGGGGGNMKDRELDNAFVVKLPVPNDKVGIIIGKGGMTIKGIQERTRAQVQIPANPDENDPGVRTLSIGGDTKESVDAAQMEIFMALQSQQQQAQQAYNSTATAMGLMVPDDKVGIIIGKGGVTIKDIQNRLKVRVQIPQQPDIGSNPPMRTISIIGAADMQAVAKYEIEMIVSGTPLHNGGGGGNNYGGNNYGQQSNPWDPQAAVFGSQQQQYGYGAQAGGAYGAQGGAYGMQQQYGAYGAYGAAPEVNPYIAQAQAQQAALLLQQQQAAQTAPAEVPTDPTAYYNDFWQYTLYYGEPAARLYYGAWSPPEGTPAPQGLVAPTPAPPTDPLVPILPVDTNNAGPPPAEDHPAKKERREETSTTAAASTADAPEDPEAAAAAWELYKKQVCMCI